MSNTDRATCWSITINNPTDVDTEVSLPAGWKLQGQFETGKEGTRHFQGMLTTPQVRFSAVKRIFPKAHIEVAKNKQALAKYVKKEDTRVGVFESRESDIPTLWAYQEDAASRFPMDVYRQKLRELQAKDMFTLEMQQELFMELLDELVTKDIDAGRRGVEFIAINPMWRSAWKRFGPAMVRRANLARSDDQSIVGSLDQQGEGGEGEEGEGED